MAGGPHADAADLRCSAASVMAWDRDLLGCVELWARVGMRAIGLNLAQHSGPPDRLVRSVQEHGLAVSTVQGIQVYDLDAPTLTATHVAQVCDGLDVAAALGADCVVVLAGPRGALTWDEAMARVVAQTEQVLPEVHARDLRLAIEPMSPIRQDLSFVNLAADAVDIVKRVGDPAFGYLFDVYHLWWQRDVETLARGSADHVFGVQVSDHKAVTVRALDRAVPGAGVVPLPGLLHALADGGYDGWWELEVISAEPDAADVEALLAASVRGLRDAWRAPTVRR